MEKENALALEWDRNVRKIAEKNASFQELAYFINTASNYSRVYHNNSGQKLAMLGNLFPVEIVRAMDIDYCYVYGGSFAMTVSRNDTLPEDTDDVARSIYGIIKSEEFGLRKSDVLLIPLYSDDMRKLRALVSDFVTVICYEVPIDKEDPLQKRRFVSEINRVVKELEKYFHKRLSFKKLKEQFEISKKASEEFFTFESLYLKKQGALSASAFLLIVNSYHLCRDVNEWIMHLHRMNEELRENQSCPFNDHAEIILLASPVYGPNYKIILVIEEMGLNVRAVIHPDIQHLKLAGNANGNPVSVRELALRYLAADISPVYIWDNAKDQQFENVMDDSRISGIIAPVIKGQLDYEYEIKRVEKLAEKRKIPLIRIETIYAYHDFEQIRVRIEAFSEMLSRKKRINREENKDHV